MPGTESGAMSGTTWRYDPFFALVVLKKIRESGVASFCEQPNHL
jgi:hypothetical protein